LLGTWLPLAVLSGADVEPWSVAPVRAAPLLCQWGRQCGAGEARRRLCGSPGADQLRRPTRDGAGGAGLFTHGGCLGGVPPCSTGFLAGVCRRTAARRALEFTAGPGHGGRGHTRAPGLCAVFKGAAHLDPRAGTTDAPCVSLGDA